MWWSTIEMASALMCLPTLTLALVLPHRERWWTPLWMPLPFGFGELMVWASYMQGKLPWQDALLVFIILGAAGVLFTVIFWLANQGILSLHLKHKKADPNEPLVLPLPK